MNAATAVVVALALTSWSPSSSRSQPSQPSQSAQPSQPRVCATMALLAATRTAHAQWNTGVDDLRPATTTTLDSAVHPLVLHFDAGVTPERAAFVMAIFDDAWEQQVTVAGFGPPLGDGAAGGDARFDVYVIPLGPGLGGITLAKGDDDPNDGKQASSAFIEIDPTLPDDLLTVFSHHEFQHALQFAIDISEPIMWFESNAVFWEVRTRPDVADWVSSLPDFQAHPEVPIFGDAVRVDPFVDAPAPRFEYGAALFALYLDEVHGDGTGTLLRQIWQGCPETDGAANEPDFIDAMTAAGVDVPAAIADFSEWRALVGPLLSTTDGPAAATLPIPEALPASAHLVAQALVAATLDGRLVTTGDFDSPYALGCAMREVTAPNDVEALPVEIDAQATLPSQTLALSTLIIDGSSSTRVVGDAAAHVHASVSVPRNGLLQFAVCDVSPADPDDALAARPIRLSVLRTDVSFPDAGPAADDAGVVVDGGTVKPPEPTCSCQGAGDPRNMRTGIAALGVLVSLFALGVRGLRARRRKALFKRRE